jgi:hypothetical protein
LTTTSKYIAVFANHFLIGKLHFCPMTKPDHLKALQSTRDALASIRRELKPFVRLLANDGDGSFHDIKTANDVGTTTHPSNEKRAQAQCVVALSIGTLRYMGARLQGSKEERRQTVMQQDSSSSSSLRQELDQMRKVLVELEKKRKANDLHRQQEERQPDVDSNSNEVEQHRTKGSTEKAKKETTTKRTMVMMTDSESGEKDGTPAQKKANKKSRTAG